LSSNSESEIEIEIEIDENVDSEQVEEQKPEFFEPEKKRNLIPFIVFPLLIIVASIILYWYLEYYKKNETTIKTKHIVLKSNNVNVISRSFDIPVSYPYKPKVNQTTISEAPVPKIEEQNVIPEKVEEKKPEQIKPEEKKVVEKKPENVDSKQISSQNNKIKEINKNILPTGKSLNVGNNIYKYENYFVVQVAAFRSKSISENEAGKYRNKGLNAFVESAEIPDRGIWYRVRVGNFSSKEEAQKFLEKNIR
jgi:cell division septation protein DedD